MIWHYVAVFDVSFYMRWLLNRGHTVKPWRQLQVLQVGETRALAYQAEALVAVLLEIYSLKYFGKLGNRRIWVQRVQHQVRQPTS
jgi:hypothetical protein